MIQWIKFRATNSDDLSLIPVEHIAERHNQLQVDMISTSMPQCAPVLTCTNSIEIIIISSALYQQKDKGEYT